MPDWLQNLQYEVQMMSAKRNLIFDAINDNLPEIKEMYGNNSWKISCDIYIDDRSYIPEWE